MSRATFYKWRSKFGDTDTSIPEQILGDIARFMPTEVVFNLIIRSGDKQLMRKMQTESFYLTNPTPMCFDLKKHAQMNFLLTYMNNAPAHLFPTLDLIHFKQDQLEEIFSLFSKKTDQKGAEDPRNEGLVIMRVSSIMQSGHWVGTSNKLELSKDIGYSWILRRLVLSNDDEAKTTLTELAQSNNRSERLTAAVALADLVLDDNHYAKTTLTTFAQSQNWFERVTAARALSNLVREDNIYAKTTLTTFAQSQNWLEQDTAAGALSILVREDNIYAKTTLTTFAQSQNFFERVTAGRALSYLVLNDNIYAKTTLTTFAQSQNFFERVTASHALSILVVRDNIYAKTTLTTFAQSQNWFERDAAGRALSILVREDNIYAKTTLTTFAQSQ